ncbi:protein phosphatase 1 regulatory subunit 42 isoform X2 [Orussus abietinus]|uniref:protein phosphatase 1 regulatory subunit 42 isoform X2 n=1 Tax=Orussus abietinus TaxID=222816 RepID=UPI0006256047|nr:protein phosphatase 1 regulatory subunit 42 isoform X2 [Orussus abietinus]
MVRLTTAYVERKCSQTQASKSLTKDIQKDHLKKITHLYMNEKYIRAIGDFSVCTNLKVIYLHNNCIAKIENLQFAVNLIHLYLQHNNIRKIENLNSLRNLKKLYLGYNYIKTVEALEELENLEELQIEKQKLLMGESLEFESNCANTLSGRLKILNISGNRITTLRDLNNFQNLEKLDARENLIDDMNDLLETTSSLPNIFELSLQGNPVTKRHQYRESLIGSSHHLKHLDGKLITEVSRQFMMRFKTEKLGRPTRRRLKMTLSDDITSSLNLPPAFKRSVSRAIVQSGPKLSISVTSVTGELHPQYFPPWRSTPAVKSFKNNRFTPRPFWRCTPKNKSQSPPAPTTSTIILPPI